MRQTKIIIIPIIPETDGGNVLHTPKGTTMVEFSLRSYYAYGWKQQAQLMKKNSFRDRVIINSSPRRHGQLRDFSSRGHYVCLIQGEFVLSIAITMSVQALRTVCEYLSLILTG